MQQHMHHRPPALQVAGPRQQQHVALRACSGRVHLDARSSRKGTVLCHVFGLTSAAKNSPSTSSDAYTKLLLDTPKLISNSGASGGGASLLEMVQSQAGVDLDALLSTNSVTKVKYSRPLMDTASPLEAPSFSDRALAARIKILRAVLSARLTGSDEEAPQQRLKDGPTELWLSSNAVADVAGALILLVQAGQLEQVVQQGSAFLKGKGKAPQAGRKGSPSAGNASSTADVALCVAWAHAALALDPGPASVEARYEHCTSALELLERCQVAAPQMTAQLQEIKEALTPGVILELLSTTLPQAPQPQPTTSATGTAGHAAGTQQQPQGQQQASASKQQARSKGMSLLKGAMWARGTSPEQRAELVSRARPLLMASELISLYEHHMPGSAPGSSAASAGSHAPGEATGSKKAGSPQPDRPTAAAAARAGSPAASGLASSTHSSPAQGMQAGGQQQQVALLEQELYDLAMAHVAEGYVRRKAHDVLRADQLLALVAEQSQEVDVSLERQMCALLLGSGPEEAAALGSQEGAQLVLGGEEEHAAGAAGSSGAAAPSAPSASPASHSSSSAAGAHVPKVAHSSTAGSKAGSSSGKAEQRERAELEAAAESWLALTVLGSFPEKAGTQVSLKAWFGSPSVLLFNQVLRLALEQNMRHLLDELASSSLDALGQLQAFAGSWLSRGKAAAGAASSATQQSQASAVRDALLAAEAAVAAAEAGSTPSLLEPASSLIISPGSGSSASPSSSSSASSPSSSSGAESLDDAQVLAAAGAPQLHPPQQPLQQIYAEALRSSLGVQSAAAGLASSTSPLWIGDSETGSIRPRMRARIVEGGLPPGLGLETAPLKHKRVFQFMGLSSHALMVGVVAALTWANRGAILERMQQVANSGPSTAWPLASVAVPTAHGDVLQALDRAEGLTRGAAAAVAAAGGASTGSRELSVQGAEAVLQAWQVLRAHALGAGHPQQLLPRLLGGKELSAVRKEASAAARKGSETTLTGCRVRVTRVEAGADGRQARVHAVAHEQGFVKHRGHGGEHDEIFSHTWALEVQLQQEGRGAAARWRIVSVQRMPASSVAL